MASAMMARMSAPPDREPEQPSKFANLPFYYGWVIVGMAGLTMFVRAPAQALGLSLFVDPIADDLELSRTVVSAMFTGGALTAAVAMIFVGRLVDRYGSRVMLTASAFFFGLAAIGMSRVEDAASLYAGMAGIRTAGQGALLLIATTMVSVWFIRLRGRATALTIVGGAVSWAAFPPLAHVLISQLDWRQAWIVVGLIIWGLLLLPSALFVRRSPESVGLLPDGDQRMHQSLDAGRRSKPVSETDWSLREAIGTGAFWLILLAMLAPGCVTTALMFHHVSIMASHGIDTGIAAAVLSSLVIVSFGGIFASGFLADLLPNRFLLVAAQVGLILSMLLTLGISQPWHAFIYGSTLGLTVGFITPLGSVIWANYFGRRYLGSVRGASQVGTSIFAAIGPLLFSVIFDLTHDYNTAVLILLAAPVASAIAALLALPPQKRADQVRYQEV